MDTLRNFPVAENKMLVVFQQLRGLIPVREPALDNGRADTIATYSNLAFHVGVPQVPLAIQRGSETPMFARGYTRRRLQALVSTSLA